MNGDEETTISRQPLLLDKVGSDLAKQLMKVVDEGYGPIAASRDYAEAGLAQFGDPEKAIKQVIAETAWSVMIGIGLPVTQPENITSQAILNARMVGAIAHLSGWDLQDELVRNRILITIAVGKPNAALAEFGVTVAQKGAEAAIKKLPIAIVCEINKRVGFALVEKDETRRSVVTLSKLVPGFGGFARGAIDVTFTRIVGHLARKSFPAVSV